MNNRPYSFLGLGGFITFVFIGTQVVDTMNYKQSYEVLTGGILLLVLINHFVFFGEGLAVMILMYILILGFIHKEKT